MEQQEKTLVIIDDKGQEITMEVVFVYNDEETKEKYVFYIDPSDEEGEVFVSAYDDDGHLRPIEDDAEWKKLDEVFENYVRNEEEQEEEIEA